MKFLRWSLVSFSLVLRVYVTFHLWVCMRESVYLLLSSPCACVRIWVHTQWSVCLNVFVRIRAEMSVRCVWFSVFNASERRFWDSSFHSVWIMFGNICNRPWMFVYTHSAHYHRRLHHHRRHHHHHHWQVLYCCYRRAVLMQIYFVTCYLLFMCLYEPEDTRYDMWVWWVKNKRRKKMKVFAYFGRNMNYFT